MTIEFLNKGSSNKTIKIVSKNKPITLGTAENTTAVLSSDSKELTFNLDSGNPLINTENKIFGNASFETKSLGDSLYTNSNVITGGATPFTIEYYFLYKGKNTPENNAWDAPIFTKYDGADQGNYFNSNTYNLSFYKSIYAGGNADTENANLVFGKTKLLPNTINKVTMTYDSSAIRVFINDKLDNIIGSNGLSTNNKPLRFLSRYDYVNATNKVSTTFGLIDNINIHDGIATKVRDTDPYEEFLVVDLAFDGENNSTKIVDNGKKLDQDYYNRDFILNYKSGLYDVSKIQRPITVFDSSIMNNVISLYQNQYLVTYINPLRLNDFTIESYVAYSTSSVGGARIFELGESVSNRTTIVPKYQSYDGVVEVNNVEIGTIPYEYRDGVYRHHCLMRKNGIFYYFVDGSLIFSHKAELDILATKLTIGAAINAPVGSLQGSMSYFRISNSAIYSTTGFLYPTEIESENKWTVNGNAKISTDQKFDGFSSLFIPTNSYVSSAVGYTASDEVTISMNFMPVSNNNYMWGCLFTIKDGLCVLFNDINTGSQLRDSNNSVITTNPVKIGEWNSLIVTLKGSVLSFNLNGIVTSNNISNPQDWLNTSSIMIGKNNTYNIPYNGYIKNFKIYKDVAIIHESPVGKIQLDFDNNLNDKYGNSTWTNNGVTFDQVNSVSGYAVSIDNNKFISTNTQNLNLSNLNSVIEFDVKPTNNITSYSNVMRRTDNTTEFMIRNNATGVYNSNIFLGILGAQTFNINNYYNWKMIRVDNGNLALIKFNDILVDVKNNGFVTFDISDFQIGQSSNSIAGYVDNFKVYKEDLISEYTNRYGEKLKVEYYNEDLVLKCTEYLTNPMYWHTVEFKDFILPLDFIIEFDTYFSSDNTSLLTLIYKTSQPYSLNHHGYFGYCLDIGSTIWFGRGGNNASTTSTTEIFFTNNTSSFKDNNYHKIKIVVNGNNHKLYIDETLYMDVNDSQFSNIRSSFALSSANNAIANRNMRIKNINVYDLNNNLLYHKDWKSKTEVVIDKPAVHLPLETNAINIGFTPLTINSVGNPTYTTVDGKKCAEFIAGRYISINDNNIFKMGIESDFYFECMFYTSYRHTDGFGQTLINNGTDNQSNGGMWIQINSTQQSDTGHISIAFNNQTFATTSEPIVLSAWNKLVFKRKNKEIFLILNDVITKVPNFDVNFSKGGSFTIGQVIGASTNATFDGKICDIKMFVGTSEIPETYNYKKVLDLDFKPTGKSYLFKDNNNKCIIHPVNITQRDYQNSQYCCSFNGTNQYLQLGKNDLLNFGKDDFVINIKFKISDYSTIGKVLLSSAESSGTLGRAFISIESTTSSATRLRSLQILTTNSSGASVGLGSSNDVLLNEINNVIITRSGSKLTINLNGVITSRNDFNEVLNFNLNNNTYIGWRNYQSQVYLDGTIYSINILRNTSDIELLEKEEDDWVVNEGYKLEGNNIKYTGYKVYNENIYDSYAYLNIEEALVRSFKDSDMRSRQAFIDATDELTGVTDWTVDVINNRVIYTVPVARDLTQPPTYLLWYFSFSYNGYPTLYFISEDEARDYIHTNAKTILGENYNLRPDRDFKNYLCSSSTTCNLGSSSAAYTLGWVNSEIYLGYSSVHNPNIQPIPKEERYIPFDVVAQKIKSNSESEDETIKLISETYKQEVANSIFNEDPSKRFITRIELIPQFEVNKKLRTEGGEGPSEPEVTNYTLTSPFIDSVLNPERGSTKTITGTIIGIKEQPIVNLTINNSVINPQEILIEKDGDNYLFTYKLPLDNYENNVSIVIVTQAHNITKSLNRTFTISREYDVPLNKLDLFGMHWEQQSNTNKVLVSKNSGDYNLMFKNGSALYSYNKSWTFGLDAFTIEFDINITNFTISGYNTTVLSYGVGGRYNGFYSVEISPAGYITFGDDTFKVTSDTSNIKINTNHRVAITRDTNRLLRIYVDGVKVLERSFDINLGSTIPSHTDSIIILGKRGDNLTDYSSNRHFTGYLANVYISKGVCLYSDSSYILEPKTVSVAKSLLTFNTEVEGNINDSYNTNLIWTNTGCTASDLGLTFNNTNSRLISQKSDLFNINGVDSWTIDLVVRPSQTNEEVVLLDTRALVTDYKGIVIRQPANDPTSIQILIGKDTDEYDYSYKMSSGINSLEPWKDVRIKLVKSLNNIYLFINGAITQTIDVGFDIIPTKDNWILGNSLAFDRAFKGHLKQFRFIKHVATNIRAYTNTDEELV